MAKPAATSNAFNPEIVNNLLNKIDGCHSDLDSERGSYMKKCRDIRESIEAIYEEAKAQGVPKKELRILVKIREKEAQASKLYNELEPDQQITVAMLAATEKVADLPLWRSASDRKPVPGVDVDAPKHNKPMFN